MNKLLLYANYITILLLIFITVFAFADTIQMYNTYGYSYEVTTIVEGENSTRVVTVWEKLMGGIIFLCGLVLLTLNTLHLMSKREFPVFIP